MSVGCSFPMARTTLWCDNGAFLPTPTQVLSLVGVSFWLFHDMLPYDIPCGPCSLEIETACNGIDVEHLACEEEMGANLAFKRMLVDIAERYSPTGDKLFLERPLSVHLVEVVGKRLYQEVATFLA